MTKLGLLFVCAEAFIALGICKLKIIFTPFERYACHLGISQCETLREEMNSDLASLRAIRFALRVVPKRLPWKSQCLDQAMAAQRMLARRQLQTTLYLGMGKEASGAFIAHAWLRCGKLPVVGYPSEMNYAVVGTYAWLP